MAVVLTADANPGVASWSTSLSEVAPVAVVADPGTGAGAAIPVALSETISLSLNANPPVVATNTIAAPTFAGQELLLAVGAFILGNSRTIGPFPAAFNNALNTNITFNNANQYAMFKAFRVGAGLRWVLITNEGATLS